MATKFDLKLRPGETKIGGVRRRLKELLPQFTVAKDYGVASALMKSDADQRKLLLSFSDGALEVDWQNGLSGRIHIGQRLGFYTDRWLCEGVQKNTPRILRHWILIKPSRFKGTDGWRFEHHPLFCNSHQHPRVLAAAEAIGLPTRSPGNKPHVSAWFPTQEDCLQAVADIFRNTLFLGEVV